jgi:hypothetical protein
MDVSRRAQRVAHRWKVYRYYFPDSRPPSSRIYDKAFSTLQSVPQFPNVPRPVVSNKPLQGAAVDTPHVLAELGCTAPDQMLYQRWNVVRAIPQCRHMDRKGVEPDATIVKDLHGAISKLEPQCRAYFRLRRRRGRMAPYKHNLGHSRSWGGSSRKMSNEFRGNPGRARREVKCCLIRLQSLEQGGIFR